MFTANFPQVIPPPIWQFRTANQQTLTFEEKDIDPDGDCGFSALDVTREMVVATLLSDIDNIAARRFLAPEIKNVFLQELSEIPNSLRTRDYLSIIKNLRDAETDCDQLMRDIKNPYEQQLGRELKLELDAFVDWLKGKKNDEAAQQLTNIRLRIFQARDSLNQYCCRRDVYELYVREYLKRQWLGYKSALWYAKKSSITLYIFRKQGDNGKLICNDGDFHKADNPIRTVYMLHTWGFTHFNLLLPKTTNSQQNSYNQTRKKEKKKKAPKKKKSKKPQVINWENDMFPIPRDRFENKENPALEVVIEEPNVIDLEDDEDSESSFMVIAMNPGYQPPWSINDVDEETDALLSSTNNKPIETIEKDLLDAIRNKDVSRVRKILTGNNRVDVNYLEYHDAKPPLLLSIRQDVPEIALLLVQNGADINGYCSGDLKPYYPPLLAAIRQIYTVNSIEKFKKYVQLIETLLSKGADPNIKQGDHGLAFSELLFFDNQTARTKVIANVLLKHKANPNLLDDGDQKRLREILSRDDSTMHSFTKVVNKTPTSWDKLLNRLRQNDPTLRYLNLGGCGFTDVQAKQLVEAMRSNTHVVCINLNYLNKDMRHLHPDAPFSLGKKGKKKNHITAMGAKLLSQLSNVKVLDISGNPIGDKGFEYLSGMPNLRRVNVLECGLTQVGLQHFLRSRSIEGGSYMNEARIPYEEYEKMREMINRHGEENKARRDPVYKRYLERRNLKNNVYAAIREQNIERLAQLIPLLPNGVNSKLENDRGAGYTPLHYACSSNSPQAVRYLLSIGANTEIHSREYTPLYSDIQ